MIITTSIRDLISARARPGELRSDGLIDRFSASALTISALLYVYFDLFGGVVRYIFASGLTPLIYTPAVVGIAALAAHVIARIGDPRTAVGTACVVGFIVIDAVISIAMGRQAAAVLFELYIWLPILVMMALAQRRMQDRVVAAMAPVFFVAVAGILLNKFVQLPWTGATYEVMGFQRDASREWSAYGMNRLSGFSRASTSAASQILLAYCVVEHRMRSLPLRAILWAIGLVAIYYTTSKAPTLAMVLLPATYAVIGRIRVSDGARRRFLAYCLMAFWVLLIFAGPFVGMVYGQTLYPAGPGTGMGYSSLADRMLTTWPLAIGMADWHNPVTWLFGRGIGGIGASTYLFELTGNPADNLAIYLVVTFGALALILAYLLFVGGRNSIESSGRGRRDFAMIIAMLGIGSAANVIEATLPAMIFGLAIARSKTRSPLPESTGRGGAGGRTTSRKRRRAAEPQTQRE